MAANVGRKLVVSKNAVPVAGARNKSISTAMAAIDITSDDDLGYRTFLDEAGEASIDISLDGVFKDDTFRLQINDSGLIQELTDITLTYPNGDEISGNFFLSSYEETGTYNDAISFTLSLQSSGQWTFTAAP